MRRRVGWLILFGAILIIGSISLIERVIASRLLRADPNAIRA